MKAKEAIVVRFKQLMKERNMRINTLANLSGVTPSTVYSMIMEENRKDVGISLIKKLCDGLDMSLREFFDAEIFDDLEQELE